MKRKIRQTKSERDEKESFVHFDEDNLTYVLLFSIKRLIQIKSNQDQSFVRLH